MNPPKNPMSDMHFQAVRNLIQTEVRKAMQEERQRGNMLIAPLPGRPLPLDFEMPMMEKYDGSTDPRLHLMQVDIVLRAILLSPAQIVRAFPLTLEGVAMVWYQTLSFKIKNDIELLWAAFREHFLPKMGEVVPVVPQTIPVIDLSKSLSENFSYLYEKRLIIPKMGVPAVVMPQWGSNAWKYCRYCVCLGHDADHCGLLRETLHTIITRDGLEEREPGKFYRPSTPKKKAIPKFNLLQESTRGSALDLFDKMITKGLLHLEKHTGPLPDMNTPYCQYHRCNGHYLEECISFVHEFQKLVQKGIIIDVGEGMWGFADEWTMIDEVQSPLGDPGRITFTEDENRWIRDYLIKYHLNEMPALVEFLEEQREKEFGGKQHEDMEV